jgi:hypothetical protein
MAWIASPLALKSRSPVLENEAENGEFRLWLAVLGRAFKDLDSKDWRIRDDAVAFLTRPSRDLHITCDLIGFDARAVIEAALHMEELGEAGRKVYLRGLLDEEIDHD